MTGAAPLALALLVAASAAVHAARPMVTDDARIVDAHACQLESWVRRLPAQATEAWALPACNPTGHLELTFGGARTWENAASGRFTDNVVQAKTMLRDLDERGWGLAFTLGTDRHPARATASGWPGDPYVNLPLSIAMSGDAWVAHLNAGAVRLRDSGRTLGTWGFGNEVKVNETLYLIPEVFRNDFGRPFFQVGVRKWIVPGRVQVDTTYGNRVNGASDARWFSIGLRLLAPPFVR